MPFNGLADCGGIGTLLARGNTESAHYDPIGTIHLYPKFEMRVIKTPDGPIKIAGIRANKITNSFIRVLAIFQNFVERSSREIV
jgi:hypothetical protein